MLYCNCRNINYGTEYVAHMRVKDGTNVDEVEKMLQIKKKTEE